MLESTIQSEVVTYARALQITARKLNFGEGWPDYILLFKGQVLFIEFKAPGEKPTKLQLDTHKALRANGFRVEIVDNIRQGTHYIKEWYHACFARGHRHVAKIRRSDDQDE